MADESPGLSCTLCHEIILKSVDRNLVEGKTGAIKLFEKLSFQVILSTKYICRKCLNQLRKLEGLKEQILTTEYELKLKHIETVTEPFQKIARYEKEENETGKSANTEVNQSTKENEEVKASISVTWPSGRRSRDVGPDLVQLCVRLLRGTYKEIAAAVWKNERLKQNLISLLMKEIDKECRGLCSAKYPSMLRKTTKNDLLDFNFSNMDKELQERSPLLRNVLMSASRRKCVKGKEEEDEHLFWLPAVCASAAILLKNRSQYMTLFQLLMSLIIHHSSYSTTITRLKTLRITVSHSFLNKKLDDFGIGHDESILRSTDANRLLIQKEFEEGCITDTNEVIQEFNSVSNVQLDASNTCFLKTKKITSQQINEQINSIDLDEKPDVVPVSAFKSYVFAKREQLVATKIANVDALKEKTDTYLERKKMYGKHIVEHGHKLCFDNVDIYKMVHNMTENHQNIDEHYVAKMAVENRVGGYGLGTETSQGKLEDLDPAIFCTSELDHVRQRQNYIDLVSRIQVEEIECLGFLKDILSKHIPHKYSAEMSKPTVDSFLGMIFESETSSEGMAKVLADLYQYVPTFGEGEDRACGTQGVMADQLSVENAINIQFQASNAFDPAECFEGMHFEIGDFHSEMKFIQICYDHFFSASSIRDKCTLYSDRSLVKRKNVVSDVKKRFSACKRFLQIELDARVVACTLEILKISSPEEYPTEDTLPSSLKDASKPVKAKCAQNLAAKVVDTYIVNNSKIEKFMQQKEAANKNATFKCSSPDCNREFKVDGRQKRNHELKVHGIKESVSAENQLQDCPDDMYNYQISFLEYGMILRNFFDAVKEGDGDRIIQCWKFLLPYLKSDGATSRKYALEGFHLLSQVYCLLSPRDAHRLIWNRSVKNRPGPGGNIPIDLGMEHYIRIMKIIIRNIGSNASNPKIIKRYANALSFNKQLMDNFDSASLVIRRSGKHVKQNAKEDLKKIVKELMEQKAFHSTPGRSYHYFKGIPDSLLHNFDIRDLYSWINDHKRKILQRQTAR